MSLPLWLLLLFVAFLSVLALALVGWWVGVDSVGYFGVEECYEACASETSAVGVVETDEMSGMEDGGEEPNLSEVGSLEIERSCSALRDLLSKRKLNWSKVAFDSDSFNESAANQSNFKLGYSERYFWSYLVEYFDRCYWSVEFAVPGKRYSYCVDFLVVHPFSSLGVVIEVDEPYALKSGKPIHVKGSRAQKVRNKFFADNDWLVIRFTERQVVEAPKSCCKFVAMVLFAFSGDSGAWDLLKGVPDLTSVPQWTRSQAKAMARRLYRQSYLEGLEL